MLPVADPADGDAGFYQPTKHYSLGSLATQSQKHLEHAVTVAGGDGFYDRKFMNDAAMMEIADVAVREFCQQLGVSQKPEEWPPEIQQAWAAYAMGAATEVTHRQEGLRNRHWGSRTDELMAIARKHGKTARKATGW